METTKVTRFEIIDDRPCVKCSGQGGTEGVWCPDCGGTGSRGRTVYAHDRALKFELSLQDDGRTLKIFIEERNYDQENTLN